MDSMTLDPYEQQLLKVFDSYDHEHCGSLDRDGLTQLCHTLQLEEQATDLIRCLLQDPKSSRATFADFKDALLTLLGNMQNKSETPKKIENNSSPDREVSPKFVYGSKKYGRRSRPRIDEPNNVLVEQNDLNYLNKNSAVQRSNSQSEVSNSKKRKTNYKLKRCTSLPGGQTHRIHDFQTDLSPSNDSEFICTEEMLREAWKNLGVGENGYLNQTELVLVCDAIGLHKLANGVIRQLSSNKLNLDYNRISFQELLEALQQDETWSDVLDSPQPHSNEISLNVSVANEIFPDSRTFQYVTLGPNGNGQITAESLIEMWELVGITAPKELIHELGFNERQISIVDLAAVLEKEIKGMSDSTRADLQNPQLTLLQANLTLYQSEIKCLKSILEQSHAEKEKLKGDVFEANNRANLLAQEVDDNHLKMERNTQNQVKLLEMRHVEILKEITQQHTADKDHLSALNQSLEEKIANLEQEVCKLKNDLVVAHKFSLGVEKENHSLSGKIVELEQVKEVLSERISLLESEKQRYVELEQEQLEPLLAKLSELQLENSQLRDRNDEMVAEVESLASQVSSLRSKVVSTPTYNTLDQSMDENNAVVCEGVGLGAKRRSECSPTKDTVLFSIDSSPRLGKVPKFQNNSKDRPDQLEIVPFASNESGFETEIDCFESSEAADGEEVRRLRAKIVFLEQLLTQHSVPVPADPAAEIPTDSTVTSLKSRVLELEALFKNLSEVSRMINKNGLNSDNLKQVSEKLEKILSTTGDHKDKQVSDVSVATENFDDLETKIEEYEAENKQLTEKCTDLENCIELLRTEYEKCEDYWQQKLDEERQIFEQEQVQSNDKLTDLIKKMSEYEEQFASVDAVDNRLPTIEESFQLEQQFTDLEREFENFKIQSETDLCRKDEEIAHLKEKLTELALRRQLNKEIAVQTRNDERINETMNGLSLCVVETTNIFSADAMPVQKWGHEDTADKKHDRDYVNPTFVWNKETSNDGNSSSNSMSWQNQASASNSSTLEKNSTPCRPKRTRKHERNTCLYKKNNQECKNKTETDGFPRREEQMVSLPVSTIHCLNGRLHHLEQRCRQLQVVLKQQHFYTEQTLQQCRQHHRGEKAELQCILRSQQEKLDQQVRLCNEQLERLARSDMLIKELYVENSYLIAKVQRLEQQCHMLIQCNSNSSSV